MEKQFGPDSPNLIQALEYESHALRHSGKTADADRVDARLNGLRKLLPPNGPGSMFGATAPTPKSNP